MVLTSCDQARYLQSLNLKEACTFWHSLAECWVALILRSTLVLIAWAILEVANILDGKGGGIIIFFYKKNRFELKGMMKNI